MNTKLDSSLIDCKIFFFQELAKTVNISARIRNTLPCDLLEKLEVIFYDVLHRLRAYPRLLLVEIVNLFTLFFETIFFFAQGFVLCVHF